MTKHKNQRPKFCPFSHFYPDKRPDVMLISEIMNGEFELWECKINGTHQFYVKTD